VEGLLVALGSLWAQYLTSHSYMCRLIGVVKLQEIEAAEIIEQKPLFYLNWFMSIW
jgi:hypothetical protein